MNIIITGRHLELTEPIRKHAQTLLADFFADKANLKVSSIRVILEHEHQLGKVEILVSMKNHEVLSRSEDQDLYKAINQAVDRMAAQITRHLTKVREHQAPATRDVEAIFNPA